MTNVEIALQTALKALNFNLLKGKDAQFIRQIGEYDKKQLKKLSPDQYVWLRDISKRHSKAIEEQEAIDNLPGLDNTKTKYILIYETGLPAVGEFPEFSEGDNGVLSISIPQPGTVQIKTTSCTVTYSGMRYMLIEPNK